MTLTSPVDGWPPRSLLYLRYFPAAAPPPEPQLITAIQGQASPSLPSTGQSDNLTFPSGRQLERMGFDLHNSWRISHANVDFKLCASYPRYLLVPGNMSDEKLEKVARFRALRRVPTVCWR